MSRTFLTIAALVSLVVPATATAQQNVLEQLYGQGVHAWNAGDLAGALDAFNRVIDQGSSDPRVYFYRGVTQSAMGNNDAAAADFLEGARVEATTVGRFFAVGRALERIQGPVRLQIEDARRDARLVAQRQGILAPAGTYPETVIRARPIVPDAIPANEIPKINLPDTSGGDYPGTPFGNAPPAPPAGDATPPAGDQPMPNEPFGDDPPPADEGGDDMPPADDDPFGGDDAPPPADDDPFGGDSDDDGDAPADDDPFGGDGGDEPPADDPFDGGDDGAGDGDDDGGAGDGR